MRPRNRRLAGQRLSAAEAVGRRCGSLWRPSAAALGESGWWQVGGRACGGQVGKLFSRDLFGVIGEGAASFAAFRIPQEEGAVLSDLAAPVGDQARNIPADTSIAFCGAAKPRF